MKRRATIRRPPDALASRPDGPNNLQSSYIYFKTDIFPGLALTEENPGLYATAYGMLADFVRAVRPDISPRLWYRVRRAMDQAAISVQIEKILRSHSFASKGQLRKLLEVLHRNMDAQATLKPDRVIKELWPNETKTKSSADVATEMNRLRHALESYYNREGKADPITICLPNRTVPGPDGLPEKRWIIAKPRGGIEDLPPGPPVNSRRGLKTMVAMAAIAALCIVAYIPVRMLTAHGRPQSGRLDGSTLTILNAEGKELWSKSFPEGFSPDWYYEQGIATRIWFGDLDNDGHTSVLFLYLPAVSPMSHSTTLICYSDRGNEKWRWTPGRDLPELHGTPATYRSVALSVLKATKKKPPRIVVSSIHDPWWPNQIAILDSNGKTISEYWHSGHLEHLTLADLDGDGREEIVATGISNGYHQATLLVLDPDQLFGASTEAARPELQIHGMGVAQERLRLLFPRSDLNKALSVYNAGLEATVEHGSIRFSVAECLHPTGCFIWYEFDNNFHLVTAYADEQFRSAHAQFYVKGKDAHPFSPEEQAEFQKVRCLAGCKSEFVAAQTQ